MTEPCAICGEPHSCPHLMRRYDNPKVTPFIPGRGRIMEVPRGEEPAMYKIVLVGFPQPEVEVVSDSTHQFRQAVRDLRQTVNTLLEKKP